MKVCLNGYIVVSSLIYPWYAWCIIVYDNPMIGHMILHITQCLYSYELSKEGKKGGDKSYAHLLL